MAEAAAVAAAEAVAEAATGALEAEDAGAGEAVARAAVPTRKATGRGWLAAKDGSSGKKRRSVAAAAAATLRQARPIRVHRQPQPGPQQRRRG